MKTSHRIAAALVTAIALASCTGGTDTNDDTDIDQPDITTDTNVEDDESDTNVEDDESED